MAAAQAGSSRRHHGAFHVRRADRSENATAATTESDEFFAAEDSETVATIKELIEIARASGGRK